MPKDVKYGCQILIKSKITRYFDIFYMISVSIFSEKLKLLFVFCVSGSDIKWIHQILMFFDTVLDNEFERENRHQNRSDFLGIRNFGPKITVLVKCRSQ